MSRKMRSVCIFINVDKEACFCSTLFFLFAILQFSCNFFRLFCALKSIGNTPVDRVRQFSSKHKTKTCSSSSYLRGFYDDNLLSAINVTMTMIHNIYLDISHAINHFASRICVYSYGLIRSQMAENRFYFSLKPSHSDILFL